VEVASRLDFDAVYQQYRLRIYRALCGVVFDDAAAEDLTQEAFMRAWRSRGSYRGDPDEIGSWIYRIAMNVAFSWLRRQRLAKLLPVRLFLGGGHEAQTFESVENRHLADIALAALSPKLRAVVVLTYFAGLTREEIAKTLDVPPGTVASRLSNAQRLMRQAIGEQTDWVVRPTRDEADA
jgi:RNA polymerase sigma-70 factor (ECF subfamily)